MQFVRLYKIDSLMVLGFPHSSGMIAALVDIPDSWGRKTPDDSADASPQSRERAYHDIVEI